MSGGYQPELASAEIYDPARAAWQAIAPMKEARRGHVLTLLADGRVLAAGGAQGASARSTASAEIYDATTDTWSVTAPMRVARASAAAARLPGGDVLVAGGWDRGYRNSEVFSLCK
jgi:hypothetical protein